MKIPDEVMSNELARNQTPNNWISSIINIYQEYSKLMYKKRLMEEAQRTAEQGNAAELGVGEVSPLGYTLSPEYTASSPPYTASSPIVGMAIPGQPQMSYGMAAAAAAAAASQPTSPVVPLSPEYTASSPSGGSIISNGVQYLSPQQTGGGIIVPSPLIPIKIQPNMGGGSILAVNKDTPINNPNDTTAGGSTKTIQISQSSLS
jgi:hypothetical protein